MEDLANTNGSSDITDSANRTSVMIALSSGTGSVDFSNLGQVLMDVSTNKGGGLSTGTTLSIDNIKLVPLPGTLALLGLGLAGLGLHRRRKA